MKDANYIHHGAVNKQPVRIDLVVFHSSLDWTLDLRLLETGCAYLVPGDLAFFNIQDIIKI